MTFRDDSGLIKGGVVVVAIFGAAIFGAATCAPGPDKATETLRVHGFRDVAITDSHRIGAAWYGCSDKDAVAHEATATNAAGQRVSVVVCCGYPFKGCTVRLP